MTLFYVYCILEDGLEAELLPSDIKLISAGNLHAAIEEVEDSEFGETALQANLQNLEWTTNKIRRHQQVIDTLFLRTNTIPLTFGIIYKNQDNLRAFLGANEDQFQKVFSKIRDSREFGVKVFYDKSKSLSHLTRINQDLASLKAQMEEGSSGAKFLLKKKLEKLEMEMLKGFLNEVRSKVHADLQKISREGLVKENLNRTETGKQEEMCLNTVWLVAQSSITAFSDTVTEIRERFHETGILIEMNGPWAPYNFVKDE